MIRVSRNGVASILRGAAPLAHFAIAAAILLRFPPEQSAFYPRCPIYSSLHLLCPGCGATRALAALLHGQIIEAMHHNALLTILFPIAMVYGLLGYQNFLRRRQVYWPRVSPAAIYSALVLATLFTIFRNLPFATSR
jgi:hypothetical protein